MNKPLRILYCAYALNPVSDASCGGAEQMLWTLEREMHRRGYHTVTAACSGSRLAGEVFCTGDAPAAADQFAARDAEHVARVLTFITRERAAGRGFHLIHDEGGSLWRHAGDISEPLLLSAHLGRDFYGPELARARATNLFVNCVSAAQRRTFSDVPRVVATILNGIALERFHAQEKRGDFLLWLGRICEEKGPHLAMAAAEHAGLPLVLAGDIYPFSYHQQYFERAIAPRLNDRARVRRLRAPSFQQKHQLLCDCRAVLIPSLASETSSLVAMEAAASGAPVIAFPSGALPQIVRDGVTGFLVDSTEAMAAAIPHSHEISPAACRTYAEGNFSATRMADEYERLYRELVAGQERGAAA